MQISQEPGWIGMFTRNEALGAWRNGTRVRKRNSQPDDATTDGTLGTVLGSIGDAEVLFYFVEWDDKPRFAVGVMAAKVGHADMKEEANGE